MPKKLEINPETNLTNRQNTLLFALVKEYCDSGETIGSKDLKQKYNFDFSSATIRNELSELRNKGYLYQPFTNASSKPTEKALKLFINQLMTGIQVTRRHQETLQDKILELQQKHVNLNKEINRLLAQTSGGVAFSIDGDNEMYSGVSNLLSSPGEGKIGEILEFLDNLDSYKNLLLETSNNNPKMEIETQSKINNTVKESQRLKTYIGGENPILPLGKGYAMVTTKVEINKGEESVVGLITPIHLLAKKRNLELIIQNWNKT